MVFDNILKNAIETSKKTLECFFGKHSNYFFFSYSYATYYISLKYLITFP